MTALKHTPCCLGKSLYLNPPPVIKHCLSLDGNLCCFSALSLILTSTSCYLFSIQDEIDKAVKFLLSLKADYKEKTGHDYKPGHPPVAKGALPPLSNPVPSGPDTPEAKAMFNKVALQGDEVRKLKAEKAEKVKTYCNIKM